MKTKKLKKTAQKRLSTTKTIRIANYAALNLSLIIFALTIINPIYVLAQSQVPAVEQKQIITIPQSAAIIITFPTTLTINSKQKKSLTVAAFLAKPLIDSQGKVVAEANSPLNIQLQPTKGGVQIVAEALVVNGLVTPIRAVGPMIPEQVVPASNQRAQANQGLYDSLAGSAVNTLFGALGSENWFGGEQANPLNTVGNLLGRGLVMATGLRTPKKTRQVSIPQGSVYILTLQEQLTILPQGAQSASLPPTTSSTTPVEVTPKPPAQQATQLNAMVTPPALPTIATVVYVNSATGVDSIAAGETPELAYRTITYALSQAQAGTVVQLATGSYGDQTGEVFPLIIKQGVTLRGDIASKGKNTVIIGGGRYLSPTFARQDVTLRAENDSIIAGITITNPNRRGTALWIESTNPIVKHNTFTSSNREGIFVTGTATPKIAANIFTKNGGNGISLARSAQGEIRRNLFQDTGFGIAIGGSASPLVVENQFMHNQDGMFISEDARPVLRSNVIKNNKRDGVVIAACSQAQPDLGTTANAGGNIFSENGQYDIHNGGAKLLIATGNQLDSTRVAEASQQCL